MLAGCWHVCLYPNLIEVAIVLRPIFNQIAADCSEVLVRSQCGCGLLHRLSYGRCSHFSRRVSWLGETGVLLHDVMVDGVSGPMQVFHQFPWSRQL